MPKEVLVTEKHVSYFETDKFSHDLKPGDQFRVGGLLMQVEKLRENDHDDRVFDLLIIGVSIKKRSKAMLILPKMLPVTVLTETVPKEKRKARAKHMKDVGYSNVEIAEQLHVSESTVRRLLKG